MENKDRRTLRCSGCNETFSYLIDIPEAQEQSLLVKLACPFCHVRLRIDLSPYNRTRVELYREGQTAGQAPTTLACLEQSLAISQQIGDKAGMCATLFNMGLNKQQNGKTEEALQTWVTVYETAREIKLAKAMDKLEKLAESFGWTGGLEAWEALAQKKKMRIEA